MTRPEQILEKKIPTKMRLSGDLRDSFAYRVATPDGTLFIFVDVDDNMNPVMVHMNAGKTGNALAAWSMGVCILINELLSKGTDITRIISLLSNITTAAYRTNPNGIKTYAGPDAIKFALLQFVKDRYAVVSGV